MAVQVFTVDIQGFWRDLNRRALPVTPGVYFVYEAAYNQKFDSMILRRLIYIGEADNIKESIINTTKYNSWLNHVRYGNELCYAVAYINATDRSRVKAAFVNKHNPIVQDEKSQVINYEETIIKTNGEEALLSSEFRVF